MDQRFVERMEWAFRTGREQMRERPGIIRAQWPAER
jgi:hypothetical protein